MEEVLTPADNSSVPRYTITYGKDNILELDGECLLSLLSHSCNFFSQPRSCAASQIEGVTDDVSDDEVIANLHASKHLHFN